MVRRCPCAAITWLWGSQPVKVTHEPGYVLHSYHYRESSLIIELMTRHYGRVSLVAKGARRWKKRGTNTYLRSFQQFSFSWAGKGEMGTLTGAEEIPPMTGLTREALYCGFYINELLMKLLHRHDPHEQLYDYYKECLTALSGPTEMEIALRIFEKRLLLETGYGLNLDTDISTGQAINEDANYQYLPNQGPTSEQVNISYQNQFRISGKSLIAYQQGSIDNPRVLKELKSLMRYLIDHQLNYKPLASRNMFTFSAGPHRRPELTSLKQER